METKSVFYEWLQAAYEIADEQLQRIALPVGTYTAKSILAIQSKQSLGYRGANYNARKDKQTRTRKDDSICVLKSFSGASYRCNISTIFKVVKELESKAGVSRKAIQTWKVEDQRMPKKEFYISLPCKKTMKGVAKMTKKSILAYDFKEGTISGKDELGNFITIPVAQESEEPLPDFIFNLPGLDLEHLYGDIAVTLYYDVDERGDYKDVVLTLISEDNWLVGLDTSQTDRKGWRRAFQSYPSSYEDDRDYRQILISISKELQAEHKSQATLPAKAESSSVEKSQYQSPSPIVNNNDEVLLTRDCPTTQSTDPINNPQEPTITDANAESRTQLDTITHSYIDQDALEYIMSTADDNSILEGFDLPAKEKRAISRPLHPTENKGGDCTPSSITELAKANELEVESSFITELQKDDSTKCAQYEAAKRIGRETEPLYLTENSSKGSFPELPDELITS